MLRRNYADTVGPILLVENQVAISKACTNFASRIYNIWKTPTKTESSNIDTIFKENNNNFFKVTYTRDIEHN